MLQGVGGRRLMHVVIRLFSVPSSLSCSERERERDVHGGEEELREARRAAAAAREEAWEAERRERGHQAMGSVLSVESDRRRREGERDLLRAKVAAREEELREARMAAAAREEAWEAERRERDEEAARLRRRLQEAEEKKATASGGEEGEKEKAAAAAAARPEEVAGKWKQLYVAIKTELDELIQRTPQGERFYFGSEQGMIGRLRKELKTKEDTMETLKSRVKAMEQEASKRDREIDILKQSLRILSNNKKSHGRKNQI
ncbi:translation initiation factor IF-2-like [Zingiber officinale]|uniref:translation initiation factor IF-2-like n=1 Tax=Zingiber officinale TaxID=94328 RepID=UPI001C4AF055|nr:translation initiation factor IF-2-like [Zingiber officinale]